VGLKVFDTKQRRKVDFVPREAGEVSIYVCGPTVQDVCHIGHARTFVAFDAIVRYLAAAGYDVRFVRNLTDVDDKIIRRAAELSVTPDQLATQNIERFREDMEALGCVAPAVEPRVTEHVPAIVAFVQRLVERGAAYVRGADVYFSVARYAAYGTLSGQTLDDLKTGASERMDAEEIERKDSPLDFVLWKGAKPGEPAWPSPWGDGRPGWHIECSTLSERFLGETFDLHGGGKDLVFPHHENEVAQSQSLSGPDGFARYWLHSGFVQLAGDGQKMSKSLGNVVTIREIRQQHDPEALRYFVLATHYRSPISFGLALDGGKATYPDLEQAERRLEYCYDTFSRLGEGGFAQASGPVDGELVAGAGELLDRVRYALDDDFNTAAAIGVLADGFSLANQLLTQPGAVAKDVRKRTLQRLAADLRLAGSMLGLFLQPPETFLRHRRERICRLRGVDVAAIDAKVAERLAARAAKDFVRADALRDELRLLGVELRDAPTETVWRIQPPA
jgi:cysteinyl-tRNA synthetase